MVSASLLMMQPPAKTSAVRASTYSPVTAPAASADAGNSERAAAKAIDLIADSPSFCLLPRSVRAAAASGHASRCMDRLAVGPERLLRAQAPVCRGVVAVVKPELIRSDHRQHVHPLVPEMLAVCGGHERRRWLGVIHDSSGSGAAATGSASHDPVRRPSRPWPS